MATTTYTITLGETTLTRANKQSAIKQAQNLGAGAVVTTPTGTVVFEVPVPKKIKMSAPYTRVVPVDQDEINGKRVAYVRKRVGFALLDANWTGEGNGTYSIYDLERRVEMGEVEVATTREAGRWFADEAPALRAQIVAEQGANA